MQSFVTKFFLVCLLINFGVINSTDISEKSEKVSDDNHLLILWTKMLNCKDDAEKKIQIEALEELLKIFTDDETDSDGLSDYLSICIKAVKNEKLLHPVRVFARINLGITHKFLAFNSINYFSIDYHLACARKNFVISLVMARKSGEFRETQEELVNRSYDENQFKNLKTFYKAISKEEVDKMEKELSEEDYYKI